MSHVFGIVSCVPDGPPVRPLAEAVGSAMARPCWTKVDHFAEDHVALGYMGIDKPLVGRGIRVDLDEGLVVGCCGHVMGDGGGLADRRAELGRWVQDGPDPNLRRLNGAFACAVWNRHRHRLTLAADRCGMRQVYYWHDPQRQLLAFSTLLRGLTCSGVCDLAFDWETLAVFAHMGHYIGEDTLFDRVRVLPVGSRLLFDATGVRLDPYWSPSELQPDESMSYDQAVDGCIELFRQAVERAVHRLPGTTCVMLSGGLDSRRIAGELSRQNVPYVAYTTHGFKAHEEDVDVARRVAETLGIDHKVVELGPPSSWTRLWTRANALTDYETVLHQWALPMVDSLDASVSTCFDGLGGDILYNGATRACPFYEKAAFLSVHELDPVKVADAFLAPQPGLRYLSPALCSRLTRSRAAERLAREWQRYRHDPNGITWMILLNRTRRALTLLSHRLVNTKAETIYPFMDTDLVDHLMRIPLRHKLDHRLRNDILEKAYPKLAEIPLAQRSDQSPYHSVWRRGVARVQRVARVSAIAGQHWLHERQMFSSRAPMRIARDALAALSPGVHVPILSTITMRLLCEMMETYASPDPRRVSDPVSIRSRIQSRAVPK